MFTIDSEGIVLHYPAGSVADSADSGTYIHSETELAALIGSKPGEWAVSLWNQLPGVTPIHTPPGEPTAKFRNKQTAVERIWKKLCELYPDAVASEDMQKVKERTHASHSPRSKPATAKATRAKHAGSDSKKVRRPKSSENQGRKSAWAEELTTELRKRFNAGEEFALEDVYKLIPAFERRHKDNHHVAARLRTTLAQDLRGQGIVKTLGRGRYRMQKA